MATMLEDYRHMDVRDADVKNGFRLVFGAAEAKALASAVIHTMPIAAISPTMAKISFGALLGSMHGVMATMKVGSVVKDYNKRWADVPKDEKRDVIAALRAATKTAKYAALAAKLVAWLC